MVALPLIENIKAKISTLIILLLKTSPPADTEKSKRLLAKP